MLRCSSSLVQGEFEAMEWIVAVKCLRVNSSAPRGNYSKGSKVQGRNFLPVWGSDPLLLCLCVHESMSLFRRFFYIRPPNGLLEITERVYNKLLHLSRSNIFFNHVPVSCFGIFRITCYANVLHTLRTLCCTPLLPHINYLSSTYSPILFL